MLAQFLVRDIVTVGHSEVYTCYDYNGSNNGGMENNIQKNQNPYLNTHITSHLKREEWSIDILASIHLFYILPIYCLLFIITCNFLKELRRSMISSTWILHKAM